MIERYTYDAFGAPTFNGGQLSSTAYNNRFLFTGREYAATYRGNYVQAFTFYEYRARAYNPMLGRFMSEDPKLFDGGDYNLFRYCHNDPVDFTDPMGLDDTAPTYSPRQTSQEREETRSASDAVWQRQMHFDRSNGAVATGWRAFKAAKDFVIATDRMSGGPRTVPWSESISGGRKIIARRCHLGYKLFTSSSTTPVESDWVCQLAASKVPGSLQKSSAFGVMGPNRGVRLGHPLIPELSRTIAMLLVCRIRTAVVS